MKHLFQPISFNSPDHTELSKYIIDRSTELFFEGGANNIYSTTASQKSIEYYNFIKTAVKILNANYDKTDLRIQQINTLFLKITLTYFHNVASTFATSTLSTKDFAESVNIVNLGDVLRKISALVPELKDFAITAEGQKFLDHTIEYRAQCAFHLHNISMGTDSPKRFISQEKIEINAQKKKEGWGLTSLFNNVKSKIKQGNFEYRQEEAQKLFTLSINEFKQYENLISSKGLKSISNPLDLARALNQHLNSFLDKTEGFATQIQIKYNNYFIYADSAGETLANNLSIIMDNHNIFHNQLY